MSSFSDIDFSKTKILGINRDLEGKRIRGGDDTVTLMKSNWLDRGLGTIVKMQTIGDGSCYYHSVLKCIYPDYQNDPDEGEREEMTEEFREKIADFIAAEGEKSEKEVIKMLKEKYINEIRVNAPNMSTKEIEKQWGFRIWWRDAKDGVPALFRSFAQNTSNKDITFKLVSGPEKKIFNPRSNYFTIGGGTFALRGFSEKNEEASVESGRKMKREVNKALGSEEQVTVSSEEIYEEDQSAQLDNLLKVLRSDEYAQHNSISITAYSLGLNIVFLKAWSNAVTIEYIEEVDEKKPYIFLFHMGDVRSGRRGYSVGHYEAGGVKRKDGIIQTLFYPGADDAVIKAVKNYHSSKQNRYFEQTLREVEKLRKNERRRSTRMGKEKKEKKKIEFSPSPSPEKEDVIREEDVEEFHISPPIIRNYYDEEEEDIPQELLDLL